MQQLRQILDDVFAGELEHEQSAFFCGTACCIAGWVVAQDFSLQPDLRIKAQHNEEILPEAAQYPFLDPWSYCANKFELSRLESMLLFDMNSIKEIQYALLDFLEAGGQLEDGQDYVCISVGYSNSKPILYLWFRDLHDKLPTFSDLKLLRDTLKSHNVLLRLWRSTRKLQDDNYINFYD